MNDQTPNIWLLQTRQDTNGLIQCLAHSDAEIRKRAAAALRTLGAVSAIAALEQALGQEKDPDVRATLAAVLEALMIELGPIRRAHTRRLVEQLKSADHDTVRQAAQELGKLKDKTAVEGLVLVFHNAQIPAPVRLAAAEALIELESPPAVVALLVALRRKEPVFRRNAAAVLGQLRADWAVGPLAERLHDENELVRRTAEAALRRIATPDALKALENSPTTLAKAKAKTAILPDTQPFRARMVAPKPDKPDPST